MICTACGDPHQDGTFCTGCGAQLRDPAAMAAAAAKTEQSPNARGAGAASYLALQASETAVLQAASRIFAAHLATGLVTDATEAAYVEKSVRTAMHMAEMTDKLVQSDDEEW